MSLSTISLLLLELSSPSTARALQARGTGSTHSLTYQKNPGLWYMNLTVTQDKEPVTVTVNTADSAFWLQTDEHCQGVGGDWGRFKPKTNPLDAKMDVDGSMGHVTGPAYFDKVCADDQSAQTYIGASDKCDNKGSSGTLGLGKQSFLDHAGFIDSLYAQYSFSERSMTFKLGGDGKENSLRFGEPDPSAWKGDVTNIPSSQDQIWTARGEVSANGKELGNVIDYVFSTGSSTIAMPQDIVKGYFDSIPGSSPPDTNGKVGSVKCGTKLPDMDFVLADKDFKVSGDAILFDEDVNQSSLGAQPGECRRAVKVTISTDSIPRGVIGVPGWLNRVIMLHMDNNTISWADQA